MTLDELERLERAATPGPWFTEDDTRYSEGCTIGSAPVMTAHTSWTAPAKNDDRLIAAARNALPDLIKIARAVATCDYRVIRGHWYCPTCEASAFVTGWFATEAEQISDAELQMKHEPGCARQLARKLAGGAE